MSAEPGHRDDAEVNCHHHRRVIERQQALRLDGKVVEHFRCFGEFHIFIIFTDKRLDYTDGGHVFLYACIQVIVFAEHLTEYLQSDDHDRTDHDDKEYYSDQEHGA